MKKRFFVFKNRGFTLTELLVTIVIMATLAAIATPIYIKTLKRSRASDALNVLSMISAKQEAYFIANGKYATTFNELAAPVEGLVGEKHAKVGSFEYTLTGLCVTASRQEDGYQISKNMQTQQEGCQNMDTSNACDLLKGLIPEQAASGCTYVPPSDGNTSLPPEVNPCVINPAVCCAGVYANGKCNECAPGTIWSMSEKKCICNATCSDGSVINQETCKCECSGSCFGAGQIKDDYCNCVCPPSKPEWDSTNQACKEKCAEPKTRWSGTECVCPLDKPIESDGNCIACDAPKIVNSSGSCVCPADLPNAWDDGKCRLCSKDSYAAFQAACEYTGNDAEGPAGLFKPETCACQCPDGATLTGVGGSCKCSGASPYFYNGTCNECPKGKQMTTNHMSSNICCLPNQITLDGKTCRYEITGKTVSVTIMGRVTQGGDGNCNISGRTYYQGGELSYSSVTLQDSSHCCKKGDITGICYKTAHYRTGCESYANGFTGGTLLSGVNELCPNGSDKAICEANCSANGSACAYKCLRSSNMPSTISKYKCYSYNNDCGEKYTEYCTGAVKGEGTMLTCVYQ